eukprot:gene47576-58283_t
MLLIPAIDLKDGHCVRLKQGDMDQATTFSEDPAAMAASWLDKGARRLHLVWLTGFASVTLFFGLLELDFYREFHQRLNSLVFQYMSQDPKTVLSMLWYGFPVVRYLLAWAIATWLLFKLFQWLSRVHRPRGEALAGEGSGRAAIAPWYLRAG